MHTHAHVQYTLFFGRFSLSRSPMLGFFSIGTFVRTSVTVHAAWKGLGLKKCRNRIIPQHERLFESQIVFKCISGLVEFLTNIFPRLFFAFTFYSISLLVRSHPTVGVQQTFLSTWHEELNVSSEPRLENKFVLTIHTTFPCASHWILKLQVATITY